MTGPNMYTRRRDQGQIVIYSYGYGRDGTAYRRVYDASDRTERWWRGEIDWDLEPEHVDHDRTPCVVEWIECSPPAASRRGE